MPGRHWIGRGGEREGLSTDYVDPNAENGGFHWCHRQSDGALNNHFTFPLTENWGEGQNVCNI